MRVTLLKDSRGESRGMAFAEFQNPRDASKAVQKSKLKQFEGFDIFVTFKKEIIIDLEIIIQDSLIGKEIIDHSMDLDPDSIRTDSRDK